MPRDVDQKKTRKALRKLRKAAERAQADGIELSVWEQEFVEGVDERLTKYGSAFADLSKGDADEALSMAQSEIVKQLDKKSRGKTSGGFTTRKPLKARKGFGGRTYEPKTQPDDGTHPDEAESEITDSPIAAPVQKIRLVPEHPDVRKASQLLPQPLIKNPDNKPLPQTRPVFRIIEGGKTD